MRDRASGYEVLLLSMVITFQRPRFGRRASKSKTQVARLRIFFSKMSAVNRK